ncbi:MAG TPA: chromosome segregation protein SMC, partial [Trueperaceae bacterium]|nr:chromosome segregation protein SMC [Trueperaceae bacterium]
QGFKSFGDRTTIEFAPGVTAIVGPNGSGKSNVIDALRWTTGGGRASAFRAEDKTDLIFHGASGKRSMGLAEVEVELVAPHGNVKIWRSLDREGTTRLRLNGRSARFLDVEEALAGSGLGRSGLAIIGQGEVSQVLMADPERLLEYVSEAAGAARLATRRDQAAERLAAADRHLEKLQETLTALQERERVLTAEAEGARRHAELTAESLRLRYTVAALRREALLEELATLDRRRGADEQRLAEGRADLAQLRSALDAARRDHERAQERLRAAAADLEARRGDVRVAEERVSGLSARLAGLDRRAEDLRAEARHLATATAPEAPDDTVEAADGRLAVLADALRAAEARFAAARESEAAAAAALESVRSRAAARERDAAAREARLASLAEQESELGARLAAAESAIEGDDLAALEAAAEAARSARDAAAAALERARQELAAVHERQALAAAEAMSTKRAAERLRAAYEARRGYAQGPRAALASGIAGVVGSVADLLRVAPEHQAAIGAALGRRAEYVVVDTAATGERVIAHVKRAGGYVTVLPLDLIRPSGASVPPAVLQRDGVVGLAADLVAVDDAYRSVRDMLLAGTVVTRDLRAATAMARSERYRPRCVTLEGEVLEASGAMSGGRRSHHGTVLGLGADLEDAEAAAEAAQRAADAAMRELEAARQNVRSRQEAAVAAGHEAERAETASGRARESRAAAARLAQELNERLAATRAALARLRAEAAADERTGGDDAGTDFEAVRSTHEAARAELDAARQARAEAEAALTEGRHERELLAERWAAHAAGLQRLERARARLAEIDAELELVTREREAAGEELAAARERLERAQASLPADVTGEEQEVVRTRGVVIELEEELARRGEEQARVAQAIEEAKVQAARRETALELVEEELKGFPHGVARLETSERAARQRLREVTEALEALGAVNHRAAGDLEEVRASRETLEVEAVQATLAVAELQSALERIDRETSDLLAAALERLKSSFGRHVQHLFGPDGRGAIEVETDGKRPTGVRIRLTPPGKQTQSLHLLSVGERTMGALAFLFALMGDGGSGLPVAVLDEVDAPLDEANIRRFGTFLARLARHGTQFILITHQKATFEVADALWSITTERGVSRVFSVRRGDEPGAAPGPDARAAVAAD